MQITLISFNLPDQSNTENTYMANFLFALCPTREAQDAITVSTY